MTQMQHGPNNGANLKTIGYSASIIQSINQLNLTLKKVYR